MFCFVITKTKLSLPHNYNTTIKIQKLTLIYYYQTPLELYQLFLVNDSALNHGLPLGVMSLTSFSLQWFRILSLIFMTLIF